MTERYTTFDFMFCPSLHGHSLSKKVERQKCYKTTDMTEWLFHNTEWVLEKLNGFSIVLHLLRTDTIPL